MADIAEITSAPAGTEKRNDSSSNWTTAEAGTKLQFNNEVRNTQSNSYTVRLFEGAVMQFTGVQSVYVNGRTGICVFCNADGDWVGIDTDGYFNCKAVGTAPGGGLSITYSVSGLVPPPPWPPLK